MNQSLLVSRTFVGSRESEDRGGKHFCHNRLDNSALQNLNFQLD